MRIEINAHAINLEPGAMVLECIRQLCPEKEAGTLGVFSGGQVLSLGERLNEDAVLTLIDFSFEEGRRIYERSLRLMLITALSEVFPDAHLRVDFSIGYGVYMKLLNQPLDEKQVKTLEDAMRALEREDYPFEANGATVGLKHIKRPFFGVLLPSTGYVKAFTLAPQDKGFVMQMPGPEDPSKPAPYVLRPKHVKVFNQSQYWCRVLETTCAKDLNRMMKEESFRQFVRVNEALHDKSIAAIADEIDSKNKRCIFVAGPTSSGKTTFSNRLAIHLRVLGLKPVVVSMDDFFFNRDTYPVNQDGTMDYEDIARIDMATFENGMKQLLSCQETRLPIYDFQLGKRSPVTRHFKLNENDPVIVEGIHALNPLVSQGLDPKWVFKVYVSCLSCVNMDDENRVRTTDVRLMRRIVRDMLFRNTLPGETMAGWQSVRAGEEKWIFPYQETADAMFNTSLHYELPVLKEHIYGSLQWINKEDPNYLYAVRLKSILDHFDTLEEDIMDEIPPLSLMREFVGGCTLYD